jgi:rubrerythrin
MSEVNLNEILDFAITEEVRAYTLYALTAKRVKNPGMVSLLNSLVNMEKGHEAKLTAFKKGKLQQFGALKKGEDLKIADYLVDVKITPESSVQDVMVFAIKAEQKAFALYSRLAQLSIQEEAVQVFSGLAAEEKQHKIDLEKAYDDEIYQEN